MQEYHIGQEDSKKRIDSFIVESLKKGGISAPSRSFLQNNWKELVTVNGLVEKHSYKLRVGDRVVVRDELFDSILETLRYDEISPEEKELDIRYEDKNFLVLYKPKGIAVHPGIKNTGGTLANYVKGYLMAKDEYDPTVERAGVVHRLDKSVSGLIVFAKNHESQKFLQKQFEEHTVNKIYHARVRMKDDIVVKESNAKDILDELVQNGYELDDSWIKVEGYIGRSEYNRMKMIFKTYQNGSAKYALSYIKFLNKEEVLVVIKTGRMYQIRATLESMGITILGDTLFESFKGGRIPEKIELESVLLSFKNMDGKEILIRSI